MRRNGISLPGMFAVVIAIFAIATSARAQSCSDLLAAVAGQGISIVEDFEFVSESQRTELVKRQLLSAEPTLWGDLYRSNLKFDLEGRFDQQNAQLARHFALAAARVLKAEGATVAAQVSIIHEAGIGGYRTVLESVFSENQRDIAPKDLFEVIRTLDLGKSYRSDDIVFQAPRHVLERLTETQLRDLTRRLHLSREAVEHLERIIGETRVRAHRSGKMEIESLLPHLNYSIKNLPDHIPPHPVEHLNRLDRQAEVVLRQAMADRKLVKEDIELILDAPRNPLVKESLEYLMELLTYERNGKAAVQSIRIYEKAALDNEITPSAVATNRRVMARAILAAVQFKLRNYELMRLLENFREDHTILLDLLDLVPNRRFYEMTVEGRTAYQNWLMDLHKQRFLNDLELQFNLQRVQKVSASWWIALKSLGGRRNSGRKDWDRPRSNGGTNWYNPYKVPAPDPNAW